jgi:hypothetical protein
LISYNYSLQTLGVMVCTVLAAIPCRRLVSVLLLRKLFISSRIIFVLLGVMVCIVLAAMSVYLVFDLLFQFQHIHMTTKSRTKYTTHNENRNEHIRVTSSNSGK